MRPGFRADSGATPSTLEQIMQLTGWTLPGDDRATFAEANVLARAP
jgi:hypothetical protein